MLRNFSKCFRFDSYNKNNLFCQHFKPQEKELMEHKEDYLRKLKSGEIRSKNLEKITGDCQKAVGIRREFYCDKFTKQSSAIKKIPHENYDYDSILGQCCEEVIGYVSIPVGLASPIIVDGQVHCVPMATTEGCLIASTNRGAKAANAAGGVTTVSYNDQMTRAPVFSFNSVTESLVLKNWIESDEGFSELKDTFDSTSRYGNLLSIQCFPAGRFLHLRFSATSGEAMGMNIISKGTDKCVKHILQKFGQSKLVSISGNMCTDKKPTAINWLLGRGKSVIAECRLSHQIVQKHLHTSPENLQGLCIAKNFSGSAMAGCAAGGYNAHAANIVAAVFAATGQDLAQVVESSNCMTLFESVPATTIPTNENAPDSGCKNDLLITCTMPSLEVGTVGGGTKLAHQQACMEMIGLTPPTDSTNDCSSPQSNSQSERFARILCATVLCAELSLMAALDTNDLVRSHLLFNRNNNGDKDTTSCSSTSDK